MNIGIYRAIYLTPLLLDDDIYYITELATMIYDISEEKAEGDELLGDSPEVNLRVPINKELLEESSREPLTTVLELIDQIRLVYVNDDLLQRIIHAKETR